VLAPGLLRGPQADTLLVVLNKRDQIEGGQSDELRREVRQVLNQYLAVPLGVERVSGDSHSGLRLGPDRAGDDSH